MVGEVGKGYYRCWVLWVVVVVVVVVTVINRFNVVFVEILRGPLAK